MLVVSKKQVQEVMRPEHPAPVESLLPLLTTLNIILSAGYQTARHMKGHSVSHGSLNRLERRVCV